MRLSATPPAFVTSIDHRFRAGTSWRSVAAGTFTPDQWQHRGTQPGESTACDGLHALP